MYSFLCFGQTEEPSEDEIWDSPYYHDLNKALKHPGNVYKLALTHRELSKFPKKILKLTELRVLLLDSNEISELPPGINQLKKLEVLDLSHNKFSAIPENLHELPGLSSLYLSGNSISSIPTVFYLLKGLRNLSLDRNLLTELPTQISSLENLSYLDISRNNISSLPRQIGSFTRLKIFAMNYNKVETLPAEFFLLTNLKNLYLGGNGLKEISPDFKKFTSLQVLALHNNKLHSVEPLMELTTLHKLFLDGNDIDSVPHTISQLYNLTDLDIGGNPVKNLPEELNKLNNLAMLNVERIKFPEFPKVLYDLYNNEVEIIGFERKEIYKVKLLMSQGRNRQLTGNYHDAIGKFMDLLALDNKNCMAMYEIASCYKDMHLYDSCIIICKEAEKRFPKQKLVGKMQVLLFNCLHESKQDSRADSIMWTAAKSNPAFSQLLYGYGKKEFAQGNYDTALWNFESAVRVDSLNEDAHFYIAVTTHAGDKLNLSIFSALRFLTLENEDSRAKSLLPVLMYKMGLKTGTTMVSKRGGVSTSYMDSYTIRDENGKAIFKRENSMADLLGAMLSDITGSLNDTIKGKNNVELFVKKCTEICDGKRKEDKKSEDKKDKIEKEDIFFQNYYLPYYKEMIAKGHLETFAYIINSYRSSENYIEDWMKKNEEKVTAFYLWSESYRWNKSIK